MPNKPIKQQLIAITGATATGKSTLALKLAEEISKKTLPSTSFYFLLIRDRFIKV
jgi:uridine kinase